MRRDDEGTPVRPALQWRQSWNHSTLAQAARTMPPVTSAGNRLTTNSHVGKGERQPSEQALRLQAAFRCEQAHAGFLAMHDGLMVEPAIGRREVAGREHAQLVAISALEHGAKLRARVLVARC